MTIKPRISKRLDSIGVSALEPIMKYLGLWDASSNIPALSDSTGEAGQVYFVSVSGTQNLGSGTKTYEVGDWVIYNGTSWEGADNGLSTFDSLLDTPANKTSQSDNILTVSSDDSSIEYRDYTENLSYAGFNTSQTVSLNEGQITYNPVSGTIEAGMKDGLVTGELSLSNYLRAKNTTGLDIAKLNPKPVYISGSNGVIADALNIDTEFFESSLISGISSHSMVSNSIGYFRSYGEEKGLDTSSLTEGALVWVDINGDLTSARPPKGDYGVIVGWCIRSHPTEGRIFVNPRLLPKTTDLSDVDTQTLAEGDILKYDSINNVWRNTANQTDFGDEDFTIFDSTDSTKIAKFESGDITTGTTREYTFPNTSGTLITSNNPGDLNHNALLNTHNLTTDIDHNTILNTHNLTTDIDHDLLTNFVANEHIDWTNASSNFSTSGNVTVGGNLTVNGTSFTSNAETVEISDNLLLINNGEVGAGVTAGVGGIEVDRGTSTNYQFLFEESSDLFKIGQVGNLQAVATREDTPTNGQFAKWNSSLNRFDTAQVDISEVSTSFVDNQILLGASDGTIEQSGNLTWDDSYLGVIGTNTVAVFSNSEDRRSDTGVKIVGARTDNTTSNIAYIDLANFDANEGASGTEYTMARVFGGMDDISGQTGYLSFMTNGGSGVAERVRIDKVGNVGIGTDTPTERLDVNGKGKISADGVFYSEDSYSQSVTLGPSINTLVGNIPDNQAVVLVTVTQLSGAAYWLGYVFKTSGSPVVIPLASNNITVTANSAGAVIMTNNTASSMSVMKGFIKLARS